MLRPPTARRPLEPLTLARPLALGLAIVVTVGAGLTWGMSGALAALCGSALSLVNVTVLERLAIRAARHAAITGSSAAAGGLQAALAAKTVVLLTLVALLSGSVGAGRLSLPFGFGLLVSVFALILAGLLAATQDTQGNDN
jgi:hypothetical protein